MPQITLTAWLMWVATLAAELGVVAVMLRRGSWRCWPSVLALASFRAAVDIALMLMVHPSTDFGAACYFWAYWGAEAVVGALEIWVVVDIAGCITAHNTRLCLMMRTLIPSLAALYLGASLLLIADESLPVAMAATKLAFRFSQASTLAWLVTFLSLCSVSWFFGIAWPEEERGIALGLSLMAISSTAISQLLTLVHDVTLLSNIQSLFLTASFGVWIHALIRPAKPTNPPTVEHLRDYLNVLLSVVTNLRRK